MVGTLNLPVHTMFPGAHLKTPQGWDSQILVHTKEVGILLPNNEGNLQFERLKGLWSGSHQQLIISYAVNKKRGELHCAVEENDLKLSK